MSSGDAPRRTHQVSTLTFNPLVRVAAPIAGSRVQSGISFTNHDFTINPFRNVTVRAVSVCVCVCWVMWVPLKGASFDFGGGSARHTRTASYSPTKIPPKHPKCEVNWALWTAGLVMVAGGKMKSQTRNTNPSTASDRLKTVDECQPGQSHTQLAKEI